MNRYAQLDSWKRILGEMSYPNSAEEILNTVNSYEDTSLEEFKKDCEAFYDLYLNILDYSPTYGLSRSMNSRFNTVARILKLLGDKEPATEDEMLTLLDYLADTGGDLLRKDVNKDAEVLHLNSSTILFNKEGSLYQQVEGMIKKIAADKGLEDITSVKVVLKANSGTIHFR